jgi:hypothetical protein
MKTFTIHIHFESPSKKIADLFFTKIVKIVDKTKFQAITFFDESKNFKSSSTTGHVSKRRKS